MSCTLIPLGGVALARGDYEQAEQAMQEGLRLARNLDFSDKARDALSILGEVALVHGDCEQAERYLQEALGLARQFGNPDFVTRVLTSLGALARVREDYAQAEHYLQEGLQLVRSMHLRPLLCRTLYQWGVLSLRRGQLEVADAAFQEMLALTPEGALLEPALAHYGLAQLAASQGQIKEAHQHGEQALAALTAIKHREATRVRSWLASQEREA